MKEESYITKIIEETGLSRKEIQERVEEKKEELKGLISEEGALFIIAKELGVNVKEENKDLIDDIDVNVSDISENMRNIVLTGRIKRINRKHEFERKDGTKGIVGSFVLQDKTGDVRIVLWDKNVNIFQDPNFDINEVVKIVNGYAKKGRYGKEIHLGRLGKVILHPEDVDYNKIPKIEQKVNLIKEIEPNTYDISVKGKIIQISQINEFQKKNGDLGRVASINLMDSTGTIRIVFWNENIDKLKDFEKGDSIEITNLSSRENKLDPKKLELHSSYRTKISKTKDEIKIKGEEVSKIANLQDDQGLVSLKGIITSIDNLKKVTLKSGEEVSLLSFTLSDETDWIRVTLWRDLADKYINELKSGTGIRLKNVMVKFNDFSKRNEITFTNSSELEMVELEVQEPKYPKIDNHQEREFERNYTKIKDIKTPGNYEVKAQIIQGLNNIIVYNACTKCLRKKENCVCTEEHDFQDRMIINLIIDDGSGTLRCTFFGPEAEKILNEKTIKVKKLMEGADFDTFLKKINDNLIGKDIIVIGRAKMNDFSNQHELSVNEFKDLNITKELTEIIKTIEV
jgi:replication factor A1